MRQIARDLFGVELIETKNPAHLLDLNDGFNKGAVVSGQLGGKCGGHWLLCRDHRVLVIADEMHTSKKKGWGASFQSVFSDVHLILMTTGTPIRSDRRPCLMSGMSKTVGCSAS